MSASLCYRFTLKDRAWEIDVMTLSLNDSIALQQVTGLNWAQIIVGLEYGDAVTVKAMWWTARRVLGEDIEFDSDGMNPRWADFSMRQIEQLTQPGAVADQEQAEWFTPPQEPAEAVAP